MIIAVNARLLLPEQLEGIGRFCNETLSLITKSHPEHQFIFIFDRKFSDEFIFSGNITPVVCFPPARHPFLWYWYFEYGIPKILRKYHADMFLSPDGWLSLRSPVKSLPVIHDLNFFHFPEFLPLIERQYYRTFFPRFINKSLRIATVSEFTKGDIFNLFNYSKSKIDVVYNAAKGFQPHDEHTKNRTRIKYSEGRNFFLFVGLIHPRKNLTNLFLAYDRFRKESEGVVKLLVVGAKKWWTNEMQNAYDKCSYRNDIVFTGRVSDDELKNITSAALGLVYISHFEGFGIPVLESMHADVPVICSSTTSLPEVGGNAVLYTDPCDVDSIKTAMIKLNSDPVLRDQLISKARIQREKFTWEKTAGLLWDSIEKCLKKI